MFRYALIVCLLALTAHSSAQHVTMYWYNLHSVAPMDEVEGKLALTRMRDVTNDSLAYFTDQNDYFQLATKTPIDWASFYDAMSSAGYYIADVTQRDTHHNEFIKMGLAYQQAHYLADHPELCAAWTEPIVLLTDEKLAMAAEKQSFLLSHPQIFYIKD